MTLARFAERIKRNIKHRLEAKTGWGRKEFSIHFGSATLGVSDVLALVESAITEVAIEALDEEKFDDQTPV